MHPKWLFGVCCFFPKITIESHGFFSDSIGKAMYMALNDPHTHSPNPLLNPFISITIPNTGDGMFKPRFRAGLGGN